MIRSPALHAVTAALLAASCALPSEPHSRYQVERDWGMAGGQTPEEAEQMAAMVEAVLPHYRGLEGFEVRPLRAHYANDFGADELSGVSVEPFLTGSSWIGVRRDAHDPEHTLAHELVHFYFDEFQSHFPTVLVEGMADLLANEVVPAPERLRFAQVYVTASYLDRFTIVVTDAKAKAALPFLVQPVPSIEEVFEFDWHDNVRGDSRVRSTLYGLGLLVAQRIGWDGLVALAKRADAEGLDRVPAQWILAAAELDPPTQANLRTLIWSRDGQRVDPEDTVTITVSGAQSAD